MLWERASAPLPPRPKKLPHRHQLLDRAGAGHRIGLHPAALIGILVGIADVLLGKHRKVAPSLGEIFLGQGLIEFGGIGAVWQDRRSAYHIRLMFARDALISVLPFFPQKRCL